MTRIKRGVVKKRRHKKLLKQTKGHKGVRHRLYRRAHESLIHALQYVRTAGSVRATCGGCGTSA